MNKNKYIKFTILFLLAVISLMFAGCKDDKEINYENENEYPAPMLTMQTPAKLDVVDFKSAVDVKASSSSKIGLRDIYVTEVTKSENGYSEIDHNKRVYLSIDSLSNTKDIELKIAINSEQTNGLMLVSTDVLTKKTSSIVEFGFVKGIPPKVFSEPASLSTVIFNQMVSVSVTATSHIGLKSISYMLISKTPSETLSPIHNVTFEQGSKLVPFTIDMKIDNLKAQGIKVIAEDRDGFKKDYILDIKSIEGIPSVSNDVVYLQNITLTNQIGAGKHNWFSCYKQPHVFDVAAAAQNQEMMDLVMVKTSGGARIYTPQINTVSAVYKGETDPYMIGFTKMTYLLITAHRADGKSAFDAIQKNSDLETIFNNTTYYGTASRSTSGALTVGNCHAIAWGDGAAKNKVIAFFLIKNVSLVGDVATVVFDIKFPNIDYRTIYNDTSLKAYTP